MNDFIFYVQPQAKNAFISVLIGGFLTLIGVWWTLRSHDKRNEKDHEYELKKETYDEVLNVLADLENVWSLLDDREDEILNETNQKRMEEFLSRINFMKYKLRLCNGNEVRKIIEEKLSDPDKLVQLEDDIRNIIYIELIPAMQNDILREQKSWWQFWK